MLAILVVAIIGVVTLWFYGSFWTTAFFIILGGDLCALLFTFEHFLSVLMCPFSMVVGYTCYTESLFLFEISGLTFMLSHERVALLITTVYSVYCARLYAGWLGLLLAFNLAFISSDVLIYFLKKNIEQQSRSNPFEQRAGMHGQPGFSDEPTHASSSENGQGPSADRNAGIPSTSGVDSDVTSEDEVVRLLNCSDHYAALGFTRYQNIDVSILKREYRKKVVVIL